MVMLLRARSAICVVICFVCLCVAQRDAGRHAFHFAECSVTYRDIDMCSHAFNIFRIPSFRSFGHVLVDAASVGSSLVEQEFSLEKQHQKIRSRRRELLVRFSRLLDSNTSFFKLIAGADRISQLSKRHASATASVRNLFLSVARIDMATHNLSHALLTPVIRWSGSAKDQPVQSTVVVAGAMSGNVGAFDLFGNLLWNIVHNEHLVDGGVVTQAAGRGTVINSRREMVNLVSVSLGENKHAVATLDANSTLSFYLVSSSQRSNYTQKYSPNGTRASICVSGRASNFLDFARDGIVVKQFANFQMESLFPTNRVSTSDSLARRCQGGALMDLSMTRANAVNMYVFLTRAEHKYFFVLSDDQSGISIFGSNGHLRGRSVVADQTNQRVGLMRPGAVSDSIVYYYSNVIGVLDLAQMEFSQIHCSPLSEILSLRSTSIHSVVAHPTRSSEVYISAADGTVGLYMLNYLRGSCTRVGDIGIPDVGYGGSFDIYSVTGGVAVVARHLGFSELIIYNASTIRSPITGSQSSVSPEKVLAAKFHGCVSISVARRAQKFDTVVVHSKMGEMIAFDILSYHRSGSIPHAHGTNSNNFKMPVMAVAVLMVLAYQYTRKCGRSTGRASDFSNLGGFSQSDADMLGAALRQTRAQGSRGAIGCGIGPTKKFGVDGGSTGYWGTGFPSEYNFGVPLQ